MLRINQIIVPTLYSLGFYLMASDVYAEATKSQPRAIAEFTQYLVYAVVAIWILKKIFKR